MSWILLVRWAVVIALGLWLFACTIFHHGSAWNKNSSWCQCLSRGPKQPGNDIDVYLRPLVEELLLLCGDEGVRMWDEYKQEYFNLRALLFVTINYWPALNNLSGHLNKGYRACTYCLDDANNILLTHYKKVVYMGPHRFLPIRHPVRKKCKQFKGQADH